MLRQVYMAQSGAHWHPNPQLMQQHSVPQGWQGPWPPPPGVTLPPNFPGPPPMPPGANAHPHWKAGYWQYNPAFNMNAGSGVPWAPGMGWGQNVPANFNPYKRIPRQPSPSYWQTQLTDNGLGLEGMVRARCVHDLTVGDHMDIYEQYRTDRDRESSRDAQEDGAPQTPWIWNPPSLTQSEGDRATPTRGFVNHRSSQDSSRSNSTPTRDYGPSRRGSQDSHTSATFAGPFVRDYFYSHAQGSVDSLGSRSQGMSQQSTPPSSSSHSRTGSFYTGRMSSSQAPPFPAPPSTSSSTTASITRIQQPLHAPVFTREPESFTTRADLQPTFSSNIVRIPNHYHGPRRNTDETPNRSSRSPSAPQTSAPGSSSRGPPAPETLSRHHSLPTPSMSSLSTFTEDVTSVLSPLIDAGPRSGAPGSLSRTRTEPAIGQAHLSTIPETMSSSTQSSAEAFFHPLPVPPDSDSDDDSSEESSPSPSRDRQRNRERERERARERERNRESGHDYDRERARRMTPYNTNSRSSNPLPPPPMERPNPAASAPPHQSPEPAHYSQRIRKGFWNKRGDHLTPNLYVVYAPHGKAYPLELREYPDETQGYKDQYGTFVPYLPERPELPTSLPYHGRPPTQPYESVSVCAFLSVGDLADGDVSLSSTVIFEHSVVYS